MSRAWDNYDNWLLQGSDVDDNTPEVFETENYQLFGISEDDVRKFDDEIIKISKDHKDFSLESYDNFKEFFTECLENLADDLNLYNDENDAIEDAIESLEELKRYAADYEADLLREERRENERKN